MKKRSDILTRCGILAAAFSLVSTSAQAQSGRFYVKGDVGGNWTLDTHLKEFFGPVAPGTAVKFDPGVRFGVAAGYQVTDWFAAEAETGVMANNIKSISGADRVDNASLANVPFLINVRLQCPSKHKIKPYVGGGVGGSASVIDADHIDYGGISMHGSQSDAVFAYQAFGGVRYELNDQMSVSLEYHYFVADSPEWKTDFSSFSESNRMRFGGTQTHAISAAFTYVF